MRHDGVASISSATDTKLMPSSKIEETSPLHNDSTSSSSSCSSWAVVAYSSSLVDQLSTHAVRLAPTAYIGARTVRPTTTWWNSSAAEAVTSDGQMNGMAQEEGKDTPMSTLPQDENEKAEEDTMEPVSSPSSYVHPDAVEYKIQEKVIDPVTGKTILKERRMTNKEKKQLKFKLKKEKMEKKKQQRMMVRAEKESQQQQQDSKFNRNRDRDQRKKKKCDKHQQQLKENGTNKHAEPVSETTQEQNAPTVFPSSEKPPFPSEKRGNLQQEDLENERAILPALLAPPVALHALRSGLLPGAQSYTLKQTTSVVDDGLAQQWSQLLKKSMDQVHDERNAETGIRCMAYRIVPEVWTRLRTPTTGDETKRDSDATSASPKLHTNSTIEEEKSKSPPCRVEWSLLPMHRLNPMHRLASIKPTLPSAVKDPTEVVEKSFTGKTHISTHSSKANSHMSPPSMLEENDAALVFRELHALHPQLRVSCGSKFGCDFLLYDGPREDRHAFAGLRIVSPAAAAAAAWKKGAVQGKKKVVHGESCQEEIKDTTGKDVKKDDGTKMEVDDKDEDKGKNKDEKAASLENKDFLPIPSPYDLTGYVRGLNTAGKLALLATIMPSTNKSHSSSSSSPSTSSSPSLSTNTNSSTNTRENNSVIHKVAFVDLTLEKILSAPTHIKKQKRLLHGRGPTARKRNAAAPRKEVGLHLDKKRRVT